MTFLALFFVGSVYLINGLSLIGAVEGKASAPLNIVIGLILVAVAGHLVLPLGDPGGPAYAGIVANAAGFSLFGIAYLYGGAVTYAGVSDRGVGWYCGWAVVVSIVLAVWHLSNDVDAKSAILWGTWAVVFLSLFLVVALGNERLRKATGWFLVATGFTTCFIPGGLSILGVWAHLSDGLVLAMEAAAIVVLIICSLAADRPAGTLQRQQI